MKLHVDSARMRVECGSGIYVRAIGPDDKWGTYDIVCLSAESLLAWLRSRGGDNPFAENVVGMLLGYGNLHAD